MSAESLKSERLRAESRAIDNVVLMLMSGKIPAMGELQYLKTTFVPDLQSASERLLDAAIKLEAKGE
jgi:hypothetical protein